MSRLPRQQGRHIVITGAGTGIGRALAVRCAEEGASLSLVGRRAGLLEESAAQARAAGAPRVEVLQADVAERGAIDAAMAEAARRVGPIHAVLANAGIGGPNAPGPDDRFYELVQTNVVGTYQTLRAAQRHLAAGPATRHMVVTASILARFGVPGYTGYCASKAALLGMVRAFALELARENVQVNAICPGWVATEMAWQGIDGMAAGMGVTREEAHRVAMQAVPLGRMGEPEEVAGMVAWLLSEDARGVTGQGLDQNGGAWMG